jgi:hypothetical protein
VEVALTDVKDREKSFEGSGDEPQDKKNPGPKKGIKRMRQLLRQVFDRPPPPTSE